PAAQRATGLSPDLRKRLLDSDPAVKRQAVAELAGLANGIEQLSETLGAVVALPGDEQVRIEAARLLGRFGPAGHRGVPGLIKALKAPSPLVRSYAAAALGNMAPRSKDILPHLVYMLRDKFEKKAVLLNGISAVTQFGRDARPAVPYLVQALGDYEEFDPLEPKTSARETLAARTAYALATGNIGPTAVDAAPLLLKHLESEDPQKWGWAGGAL